MNELLIDRLSSDLAIYLRMSCSSDWTEVDIARFLRMEYRNIELAKVKMTPIGTKSRPDGYWYAAIKRWHNNPNDFQVLEYFKLKVDCYEFIGLQPKSSEYIIEPARYE